MIEERLSTRIALKIRDFFFNIWDKVADTYGWLSDAFTNWDMDLHDFGDHFVYIFRTIIDLGYNILDKGRQFIGFMGEFIAEISRSLRGGWR